MHPDPPFSDARAGQCPDRITRHPRACPPPPALNGSSTPGRPRMLPGARPTGLVLPRALPKALTRLLPKSRRRGDPLSARNERGGRSGISVRAPCSSSSRWSRSSSSSSQPALLTTSRATALGPQQEDRGRREPPHRTPLPRQDTPAAHRRPQRLRPTRGSRPGASTSGSAVTPPSAPTPMTTISWSTTGIRATTKRADCADTASPTADPRSCGRPRPVNSRA